MNRKEEIGEAERLKATVQVGKEGLGGNVISEIIEQLDSREMVKVRFNSAGRDMDMLEREMEGKARLVLKRGRTLVFRRAKG